MKKQTRKSTNRRQRSSVDRALQQVDLRVAPQNLAQDREPMTSALARAQTLDTAKKYVLQERNQSYAAPEDNFGDIAEMMNIYLDGRTAPFLRAHDVAVFSILVKVSRLKQSPGKADNWIDIAGYAACGAACIAQPDLDRLRS